MPGKFQNKYRIPSARASWWDYGRNAAYFVTICTQGRVCYFGDIVVETRLIVSLQQSTSSQFIASPLGKIAQSCWNEIPQHFPYVQLDSFVVMPNHVHGIIIINKSNNANDLTDNATENVTVAGNANMADNANMVTGTDVETRLIASLQSSGQQSSEQQKTIGGFAGNKNPMLNNNLSRVIRWYKGRITFESHKIHADFAWQPRYYEHIIRNDQSYQKISDYIINNPVKWDDDKLYFQ
jgi:REP element-mobilizing transposase RayT